MLAVINMIACVEDIDNLGIKYKFADDKYNLTLGFYPTDGGK